MEKEPPSKLRLDMGEGRHSVVLWTQSLGRLWSEEAKDASFQRNLAATNKQAYLYLCTRWKDTSATRENVIISGAVLWHSGYLPGLYQTGPNQDQVAWSWSCWTYFSYVLSGGRGREMGVIKGRCVGAQGSWYPVSSARMEYCWISSIWILILVTDVRIYGGKSPDMAPKIPVLWCTHLVWSPCVCVGEWLPWKVVFNGEGPGIGTLIILHYTRLHQNHWLWGSNLPLL